MWAQQEDSNLEKVEKKSNHCAYSLDPFALDHKIELNALARYSSSKEKVKKKREERKLNDYADIGLGYDSDDSFVDNSDVYDEIVPETVTPQHGGFYVNFGELQFKVRGSSAGDDSDLEAVIQEGEKAAQLEKRKYRKREDVKADVDKASGPNKTFNKGPKVADVSGSKSDSTKKPRQIKEGANPPGRPKIGHQHGSLVHPPTQGVRRVETPGFAAMKGLNITTTSKSGNDTSNNNQVQRKTVNTSPNSITKYFPKGQEKKVPKKSGTSLGNVHTSDGQVEVLVKKKTLETKPGSMSTSSPLPSLSRPSKPVKPKERRPKVKESKGQLPKTLSMKSLTSKSKVEKSDVQAWIVSTPTQSTAATTTSTTTTTQQQRSLLSSDSITLTKTSSKLCMLCL